MPTCFIIMPITVPPSTIPATYSDAGHFRNVLDHLLIPAVKNAGYEAIPPIAKGAEIIIAEIIHHLAKSDMVLCDITTHNPNVFYELGIRTALDKPVALIRDSITSKIPFDTAAINVEEYPYDLRPWNIETARSKISDHIKESGAKAGGRNSAWRYFGVKDQAEFAPQKNTPQDKFDVILSKLDELDKRGMKKSSAVGRPRPRLLTVEDYLLNGLANELVGQTLEYQNMDCTVQSIDLRAMQLIARVEGKDSVFNLRHPDTLKLTTLPF
jgi:hypothetical protein